MQLNKAIKRPKTYTAEEKRSHKSLVGKIGVYSVEEMIFPVKIINERFRYGRLDVMISPRGGRGEQWVEFHKVTVE